MSETQNNAPPKDQPSDITLEDIVIFDHCFRELPWVSLEGPNEDLFLRLSSRREDDAITIHRRLCEETARNKNRRDFFRPYYLLDKNIISKEAAEIASLILIGSSVAKSHEGGYAIFTPVPPEPGLAYQLTDAIFKRWHIEQIIGIIEGDNKRTFEEAQQRWPERQIIYPSQEGFTELMALKPEIDRVREEIAIKEADFAGFSVAALATFYRRNANHGMPREMLLEILREPYRSAVIALNKRDQLGWTATFTTSQEPHPGGSS